jgi:predicted nucleotidyltransferase
MCYMAHDSDLLTSLASAAAEADRLRSRGSELLRTAVGRAADAGLTQTQIALAIGRSQPEVSRLLKAYRARSLHPSSPGSRLLLEHRDEILAIARSHRASNVRVFGSVARGEDDEASDIDLLVDLEPHADLLDLAALDIELQELLGRRVDVVPARLLKRRVAPAALAEAVPL